MDTCKTLTTSGSCSSNADCSWKETIQICWDNVLWSKVMNIGPESATWFVSNDHLKGTTETAAKYAGYNNSEWAFKFS